MLCKIIFKLSTQILHHKYNRTQAAIMTFVMDISPQDEGVSMTFSSRSFTFIGYQFGDPLI